MWSGVKPRRMRRTELQILQGILRVCLDLAPAGAERDHAAPGLFQESARLADSSGAKKRVLRSSTGASASQAARSRRPTSP